MRLLAASAILLLPVSLAHAADNCDAWTVAMEEHETGPAMTARICAHAAGGTHELSYQCGAPGTYNVRFIPAAPTGYPPNDGNYETQFHVLVDNHLHTRLARYEDMDGAMVIESYIDDSLFAGLIRKEEFTLSDVKGKVPSVTFTLKGAKEALEKLTATCEK